MIKDQRKIPKLRLLNLYGQSLSGWKAEFNAYTKIALVVAIPAAILGALQNSGYLGDYGLTLGVAWSFVFISIIYFAVHSKKLENSKISTIYTTASARFLQFLGVSLILAVFALPIVLSLFGLFLSLPVFNLPPLIFLPLSVFSFLLSSYLLARFGMAQVIVVTNNFGVIESLKKSTELTHKNRWRIFFGTFIVIIVFLIVLTAIQFVLGLKASLAQNQIISGLVYVIEAALLVPLFFIFQAEMYKELNGKK